VLDPPRDGLKSLVQLKAKKSELNTILYISCDLATFSRDAAQLQANGYDLSCVQPLDLFPQTPHVEILARFTRR
jgi:23S rRNA (uracil1939-C5)-methyltransferase